jgi:drug/metabolite transporter (DMT)-like permease
VRSGSVRSAVRAIHAAGPPCYAVVVCGRNASLAVALRREFAEVLGQCAAVLLVLGGSYWLPVEARPEHQCPARRADRDRQRRAELGVTAVPAGELIVVSPNDPMTAARSATAASAVTSLGTGMQQRATQSVPEGPSEIRTLLAALVRNPLWLGGVAAALCGFLLYLYALANAALTLAQPIMVSGVVFDPVFTAWLARHRVDRPLLAGGALCGAGLSLFLVVGRPTSGPTALPHPGVLTLAGLLVAILLGVARIVAARSDGLVKAVTLAAATAVLFGVNAASAKVVADELNDSWLAPLGHPPGYAMLPSGCAGFVVSQRAMQLGRLLAPVIVVISTVAPLTASVIDVVALGERPGHSPCRAASWLSFLESGWSTGEPPCSSNGSKSTTRPLAGADRPAEQRSPGDSPRCATSRATSSSAAIHLGRPGRRRP